MHRQSVPLGLSLPHPHLFGSREVEAQRGGVIPQNTQHSVACWPWGCLGRDGCRKRGQVKPAFPSRLPLTLQAITLPSTQARVPAPRKARRMGRQDGGPA